MIKDKLEHDERLRLECLAQAIALGRMTDTPAAVVQTASQFELYVRGLDS